MSGCWRTKRRSYLLNRVCSLVARRICSALVQSFARCSPTCPRRCIGWPMLLQAAAMPSPAYPVSPAPATPTGCKSSESPDSVASPLRTLAFDAEAEQELRRLGARLADSLMHWSPKRRPSARRALRREFFAAAGVASTDDDDVVNAPYPAPLERVVEQIRARFPELPWSHAFVQLVVVGAVAEATWSRQVLSEAQSSSALVVF